MNARSKPTVERDLVVAERLILGARVTARADAAGGDADADRYGVADRGVKTESGADPQTIVRDRRVVDVHAVGLQYRDRRVGRVSGGN